MSLQLRVGQIFMPAVFAKSDEATLNLISDYADRLGVGGVILLKGDVESAACIADSLSALAPCPLFVAVDAERGLSMRFRDAPDFLWNSQISSSTTEEDLFSYGLELARECRLTGINMVLGPVLDVIPDGRNGLKPSHISRLRSFGSDAKRVASLGVAYARGLERGGVMSVAKHFPGHGSAVDDSHKQLAIANRSSADLYDVDLFPFKKYADNDLSAIMVGHIYMPALDSVCRPAAFSRVIVSDLLRGKLKFKGLILTDAINMNGAKGYSAVDAVLAGADMVLAPVHTEREIAALRDAVEEGRVPVSVINDRCRRILVYKYMKGIAGRHHSLSSNDSLKPSLHRGASSVRLKLLKGSI